MWINISIVNVLLLLGAVVAQSAQASNLDEGMAVKLVEKQIHAQLAFDADMLEKILDDSYFEVSPVGEIDSKNKVLGFYSNENKKPSPKASLQNVNVRVYQQFSVVIAELVFDVVLPNGQNNTITMTGSWVIAVSEMAPVIVSAQYTPLRKS
jgi:hypothetical protein